MAVQKFDKRLKSILARRKAVSEEALSDCLSKAEDGDQSLSEVLVESGSLSEDDLLTILSEETHLPEEGNDDCPKYDRALLDPLTSVVRHIIMASFVLSTIISIVATKYRVAAEALYYFWSTMEIVFCLIPTPVLL